MSSSLKKATRRAKNAFAKSLDVSASVGLMCKTLTFLSSVPCKSKFAKSLALSVYEPIPIRAGSRLSCNAFPSLKNSGTNIISWFGYFFWISDV